MTLPLVNKLSLLAAIFLPIVSLADGPEIGPGYEIAWDPPPTNAEVDGYRLYCGTVSGQYTLVMDLGLPSGVVCTRLNLPDGQVYCTISAYNAAGESLKSAEQAAVIKPILQPPAAPTGLQFIDRGSVLCEVP